MRIFFRSKSFYVSVYTLCVCRAVCPVWSGWAWTASVRDLGQTEELRKKKKVGGGEYSGDQITDERDGGVKVELQQTGGGNTQ